MVMYFAVNSQEELEEVEYVPKPVPVWSSTGLPLTDEDGPIRELTGHAIRLGLHLNEKFMTCLKEDCLSIKKEKTANG